VQKRMCETEDLYAVESGWQNSILDNSPYF